LFNPIINKFLVSRDVVIDDENEWNNSAEIVESSTMKVGARKLLLQAQQVKEEV